MTGSDKPDEPVVPYQEEQEEAEAVERAEDAGEGGNLVMQARATLEDARASSESGDDAACEKALGKAMHMIEEYEAATE